MSVPVTRARTRDNVQMESMDILVNVLENIQEISVKIVKHHMLFFKAKHSIIITIFLNVYDDLSITN